MGSSGSGHLSDYSGSATEGKGSSKSGGASGEDKCGKAFTANLEEVERSEYFLKNKDVPAVGTVIEIQFIKPRLAAVAKGKILIGYLPTDRNYLKVCIENGYKYPGTVTASRVKPTSSVSITVSPHT